jgi:hypothetical protein
MALSLAACSSGVSRDFARYYDPEGMFTTNLPAANDVTVTPGQSASGGPAILTGVVSTPPQPSPSPSGQFGGGLGAVTQQTQAQDQTVYEALAVTTGSLRDLPQMVLTFLTGNPTVDVQLEQAVRLGDTDGELVVADIIRNGKKVAGVAATFTLGRQGVGYILAAIFPAGDWKNQRSDFLKVVSSFRSEVPPGLRTIPLAGGGA